MSTKGTGRKVAAPQRGVVKKKTSRKQSIHAENRYASLIESIFASHYKKGRDSFVFERDELVEKAAKLKIKLPKNVGDTIYFFRYRNELPPKIQATSKRGYEWIILPKGKGRYEFKQFLKRRVEPQTSLRVTKLPDSTPAIIEANAKSDEQAILAKVRYNRLIDIFLGIGAYSLQSHMRTTVKDLGGSQIEIDEIYVGVDANGVQYVVPVQAKVGSDRLGVVQLYQDIRCCAEKFPGLVCRPVAAQFMAGGKIALFELSLGQKELCIDQEKHYLLVPSEEISDEDLQVYRRLSKRI